MDTPENQRTLRFTTIQWILLGLAIIFSIHTHRWALYQVELPHIFVGFRAALLFLYDLPLIALLFFVVYRLLNNTVYRVQLNDILNRVLSLRYGGVWWILLIIWMGAGILWADTPTLTRYGTIHTALLLFATLVLAYMVQEKQEEPFLWLFCIGAAAQALLAIAQIIHGDAIGLGWLGEIKWDPDHLFGYQEAMFRGYGLSPHPNMLAGYLVIALFAASTLLCRYTVFSLRGLVAAAAFSIIAVGLVVTLSRTGLLAGGTALVVAVILKRRELAERLSLKSAIPLLVVIVIGIVIGAVLVGDTLIERNWGLQDFDGVENRLAFGYGDTIDVIKEAPVLGVGENNLMIEVGLNNIDPAKWDLLPAHNVFLVILAELGVVGLILFLLVCIPPLIRITAPQTSEAFIWMLAFLAWVFIMFFDYYPWLDYRTRLITLLMIGMWWGYTLRVEHEHALSEDH